MPNTEELIKQKANQLMEQVDQQLLYLLYHLDESVKSHNINQVNEHLEQIDKLIELRNILRNNLNSDSIVNIINNFIKDNPDDRNQKTTDYDNNESLIANTTRYLRLLRNSSQSLEQPYSSSNENQPNANDEINRINDPALGLELFRTYRSAIEYESTLLNQRVNWFLVTQGFLFAAFATAISVEVITWSILLFLLIISGTGVLYSFLILNPISLSLLAVDTLKKEWQERSNIYCPNVNDIYNNLVTPQVKKLLPKQVCFDAEEKTNGTLKIRATTRKNELLLYPYFPTKYNLLKPNERKLKSSNYRKRIECIPQVTSIIWLLIIFSIVVRIFGWDKWMNNKFLNPRYLVTVNYVVIPKYPLEARELKKLIDTQEDNNENEFQFKTTICLQPIEDEEKDNYEEVLAITQKNIQDNQDNESFMLSKRLYNYTVKSFQEYKKRKIADTFQETETHSKKKLKTPTPEIDKKIDYSQLNEEKIDVKESTICL